MSGELLKILREAGYECIFDWNWHEEFYELIVFVQNGYIISFNCSKKEGRLDFRIKRFNPSEEIFDVIFSGTTKPDEVLEIVETMYFYIKNQIETEKLTMELMFKEYCHE